MASSQAQQLQQGTPGSALMEQQQQQQKGEWHTQEGAQGAPQQAQCLGAAGALQQQQQQQQQRALWAGGGGGGTSSSLIPQQHALQHALTRWMASVHGALSAPAACAAEGPRSGPLPGA